MVTAIIFIILLLLGGLIVFLSKRNILAKFFALLSKQSSASQFQIELERTGQQITNSLEMQINYLEQLLAEADDKITRLETQLKAVEQLSTESQSLAAAELLNRSAIGQQAYQQVSEPELISQQSINSQPPDISGGENTIIDTRDTASDKRRLIIAMADQGYSITEIAKVTGVGKGEIILLLQLNKK